MLNKQFTVKIYDKSGSVLLKTLGSDLIKNAPSFRSKINQGFGECRLDLNLPFDDFGEGIFITPFSLVRIYEADIFHTNGRLIYTGYISEYAPYTQGSVSGVNITLLGMISLLKLAYYKNGSSFQVQHNSQDPSVIMKSIIDHFNTVIPGNLLSYSPGSVDTVGTNASYTFEEDKWFDALQNAFGTVGPDWWWVIDNAGKLWLKPKPVVSTHVFTLGKDLDQVEAPKSIESLINSVYVKYNNANTTVSDVTSINSFYLSEDIVSDSKIQNLSTAQQRGLKNVNEKKDIQVKASLVINSSYDLESIKVGDTCRLRNFSKKSGTFNDNMQIVGVDYKFNQVTLELGEIYTSFGGALKRFVG